MNTTATTAKPKTKTLHAPVVRINYTFSEDGLSRAAIAAHAYEARELFFWTLGVSRDAVHISSKPGLMQGYNFSLAAYISSSETSMPATARAAQACLPDLRIRLRTCASHQAWIDGWVPGRSTWDDMSAINRIAEGQFVRLTQEQESFIATVAQLWLIDPMEEGWTAELLCREIVERTVLFDLDMDMEPLPDQHKPIELPIVNRHDEY